MPALEHSAVPARRSAVVSHAFASFQDRTGPSREEERDHRADALHARRRRRALAIAPREPRLEPRAERLEARVERVVEALEHRQRGAHGDRVPAQRAGLVDGAERRDLLHDGALAAVRRERHARRRRSCRGTSCPAGARRAPACRRARRGSRSSPRRRSRPRRAFAHSRDDRLEEARRGRHDAHVADDRLDDDRRDLACRARRRAPAARATSLYGERHRVGAPSPPGTPAESGTPNVAAPLPAFTSRKSAWPW